VKLRKEEWGRWGGNTKTEEGKRCRCAFVGFYRYTATLSFNVGFWRFESVEFRVAVNYADSVD
jgi:hypothetical protein